MNHGLNHVFPVHAHPYLWLRMILTIYFFVPGGHDKLETMPQDVLLPCCLNLAFCIYIFHPASVQTFKHHKALPPALLLVDFVITLPASSLSRVSCVCHCYVMFLNFIFCFKFHHIEFMIALVRHHNLLWKKNPTHFSSIYFLHLSSPAFIRKIFAFKRIFVS